MAQTLKVLGQNQPGAGATYSLYTVPGATIAMLTSFHICNVSVTSDKARVYRVPSGGAAGISNALIYDLVILPGIPFLMNSSDIFATGDILVVYSLNGNLTFTASGMEIT